MTTPAIEFNYQITGVKKTESILLLHGFMGALADWAEIAKKLSEQYRVITVDLPGHGLTKISDETACLMPVTASALLNLLDDLHIDQTHLLGYSMGGRLALYTAVTHPDRFDKIILESSSPGLKTENERNERKKSDENLAIQIEKTPLKEFLTQWYTQPVFASLQNKPDLLELLISRKVKNDPLGLAASLRHAGTGVMPSLWDEIEELTHPTLIISGEDDPKYRAIAEEMGDLLPHAEIRIIKDAGHIVHLEQSAKFTREIMSFLNK